MPNPFENETALMELYSHFRATRVACDLAIQGPERVFEKVLDHRHAELRKQYDELVLRNRNWASIAVHLWSCHKLYCCYCEVVHLHTIKRSFSVLIVLE